MEAPFVLDGIFLYIISMEHWRDVPGYEGLYQISIDTKEGKCRRLHKRGTFKELCNKPTKRDNRIHWNLSVNGKSICHQAAKWIALTYPELVENEYFEGAQIDHKDTNRLNNHPSNLHWVTPSGNNDNPITKNKRIEAYTNNPLRSKQVYQYSKEGVLLATYPSLAEANRQTGVDDAAISKCCLGKYRYKSAGGFIWKYAS